MMLHAFLASPSVGALAGSRVLIAALLYQVNGLVFVFIALGAIWLLMRSLGWILGHLQRGSAAAVNDDEAPINPEVLVAIFAAAAEEIDGEVRIVAITREDQADNTDGIFAWSHEGRRQHFESHKIR